MNNHQQTELMIVKHVLLKKCIENSIDNKNTDVKMWREQFFSILLLPKVTPEKWIKFIACCPTKFCNVSVKCVWQKIPIQFFLHVQWLRSQNMIILQCFPLHNGPRCFHVLFISSKYPQYLSHLDLYDTLQSKHRLVHSSPASPDHLTSVPLTSFQ